MRKLEFDDATKLWDVNRTQNDIVWARTLSHFGLDLESMQTKEGEIAARRAGAG